MMFIVIMEIGYITQGIGNDSMPFRKFNPKLQSERYDPNKLYEKTWLND